MRWRRRRFQRLRRASRAGEFLAPELYRVFLVASRKTPIEMQETAEILRRLGYIKHAATLKELASKAK